MHAHTHLEEGPSFSGFSRAQRAMPHVETSAAPARKQCAQRCLPALGTLGAHVRVTRPTFQRAAAALRNAPGSPSARSEEHNV